MEVIYTGKEQRRVIEENDYRGFHYVIVSYGTHPCVYVAIDENHPMLDVEDDWYIPLSVHGGITFNNNLDYVENLQEVGHYIGWDYAHCDDYYAYDESRYGTHVYCVDDLIFDAQDAIDQIINWEEEHNFKKGDTSKKISLKIIGSTEEVNQIYESIQILFKSNPNINIEID